MRWEGYRKVRRQVCRKLDLRRQELGLGTVGDYRGYLEEHADEWALLDAMCRITISRFYRDHRVFDRLRDLLAEMGGRGGGGGPLRCWSAGCASGEEPWTLRLISGLDPRVPELDIVATDADPLMVRRARAARYPAGCLRNLPREWVGLGFHRSADAMRLLDVWRNRVELHVQDIRHEAPDGPFDLVLCRNLAFMYFDTAGQLDTLERILRVLRPGGLLVMGRYESAPTGAPAGLEADGEAPGVFRWRPGPQVTGTPD